MSQGLIPWLVLLPNLEETQNTEADIAFYVASLNHLCNSCRGNPPVVTPDFPGRHGGTTPT
jgi:hypothetical protein